MPLKIRSVTADDLPVIQEAQAKFYPGIELPNFNRLLSGFVIEDEQHELVMAGGIELTAEALLITNKVKSMSKIGRALIEVQRYAAFTCGIHNIRDLYAFVPDDVNATYLKHLIQHGFEERTEKVLRMRL